MGGVLTMYMANIVCDFTEGIWLVHTKLLVFAVTTLWLGIFTCVGISVNWAQVVEHYRVWQHRHGTFALARGRESRESALSGQNSQQEERPMPAVGTGNGSGRARSGNAQELV